MSSVSGTPSSTKETAPICIPIIFSFRAGSAERSRVGARAADKPAAAVVRRKSRRLVWVVMWGMVGVSISGDCGDSNDVSDRKLAESWQEAKEKGAPETTRPHAKVGAS